MNFRMGYCIRMYEISAKISLANIKCIDSLAQLSPIFLPRTDSESYSSGLHGIAVEFLYRRLVLHIITHLPR